MSGGFTGTDTADPLATRQPRRMEIAHSQSKTRMLQQSLALLPESTRRKYRLAVGLQMMTAFLDMIGVLLIGAVAVLATSAALGSPPPDSVSRVVDLLGMGDWPLTKVSAILGVCAAVLLVIKPLVTLYIIRRVTVFLARAAAATSARLVRGFFALPIVDVYRYTSQWSATALSRSVNNAVIDVLTASMNIRVEVALAALLGATLLVVDPLTTIFAICYFGLVAFVLVRGLAPASRRNGEILAVTDVQALSALQAGVATYRETTVADRRDYFSDVYARLRSRSTQAYANQQFIAIIPRYTMEIALVLGAALLVAGLLLTQSPDDAVGSMALFLAAASRVTPSLLRLNAARLSMHALRGQAGFCYLMAEHIEQASGKVPQLTPEQSKPSDLPAPTPDVVVEDLTIQYPNSATAALADASFQIPAGGRLALAGPSGAGKSTLADAILGVLLPENGKVLIGGLTPQEFIKKWPGAIAYVPQDVALVTGTVRDNVALGMDPADVDDERVWDALGNARLADFLRDSREGLDTLVGERGVQLSGGQRQRLGMARALYSKPRLLVLDEATSALDAETEHLLTETLQRLDRSVTLITVAHRLATIRDADLVLYLEDGRIVAEGSFEELRRKVSRFDLQANLLGL